MKYLFSIYILVGFMFCSVANAFLSGCSSEEKCGGIFKYAPMNSLQDNQTYSLNDLDTAKQLFTNSVYNSKDEGIYTKKNRICAYHHVVINVQNVNKEDVAKSVADKVAETFCYGNKLCEKALAGKKALLVKALMSDSGVKGALTNLIYTHETRETIKLTSESIKQEYENKEKQKLEAENNRKENPEICIKEESCYDEDIETYIYKVQKYPQHVSQETVVDNFVQMFVYFSEENSLTDCYGRNEYNANYSCKTFDLSRKMAYEFFVKGCNEIVRSQTDLGDLDISNQFERGTRFSQLFVMQVLFAQENKSQSSVKGSDFYNAKQEMKKLINQCLNLNYTNETNNQINAVTE